MSRCTAPVRGHRSASAAADCPACGSRYGRYSSYPSSYPSYQPTYQVTQPVVDPNQAPVAVPVPAVTSRPSSGTSSGNGSSGSGASKSSGSRNQKPSWSRGGSRSRSGSGSRGSSGSGSGGVILYTPAEVRVLAPVRESVEQQFKAEKRLAEQHLPAPDPRDYFLCHAWDDRKEAAKELHDLLVSNGASVWFSEKDVLLGSTLLREIDKGLAKSRVGIVLVTPAFLRGLPKMGVADKELSALLAQNRLIPITHNTTFEELREISPLLASRSGLSTAEESMAEIAAKLAELVEPEEDAS